MLKVRKSQDRGHFDLGWLQTFHSFSFGQYFHPDYMDFKNLRVLNEDFIEGSRGFGPHPHQNMEIVTYLLEGSIRHQDSLGNEFILNKGDVQRMSAGMGIVHSEMNPSPKERAHLLQIWFKPWQENIRPSYEQKNFSDEEKEGQLRMIVSSKGGGGALNISANLIIYASILGEGQELFYPFTTTTSLHSEKNPAWIQVIQGKLWANGQELNSGDGLAVEGEEKLHFKSLVQNAQKAHFLLFDLS